MNRWPSVTSPLAMPSISNGTTAPSNRQTIRFSGRTQRSVPVPQRIDLGQGKSRTIRSTISGIRVAVARPCSETTANSTPSRSTSWSRVRPVLRRKPSSACSGALVLGPLISSSRSGVAGGSPSTTSVSRRGPAKVVSASHVRPAAFNRSVAMRSRSRAAPACMRAGISSENSSMRSWGIMRVPFPARPIRWRRPYTDPGCGRCSSDARRRRWRRAHPSG